MYLRLSVCFLLVVALSRHTHQISEHPSQGKCYTSYGVAKDCVNIWQCPLTLQMLQENQLDAVNAYLKHSQCGEDNNDPLVCCPHAHPVGFGDTNNHQTPRGLSDSNVNSILEEENPAPAVSTGQLAQPEVILETEDQCYTLNNNDRYCINIRQCPELLEILPRHKELGLTKYLRNSKCGMDGRDPKVCCPRPQPEPNTNIPPRSIISGTDTVPLNPESILETEHDCYTPNNSAGHCINIRQCPELLEILPSHKELGLTEYFRNSKCGLDGRDPKVCCPRPQPEPNTNIPPRSTISGTETVHLNAVAGECHTPKGKAGNCVPVFECPELQSLVRDNVTEVEDYFKKSECGVDLDNILYCCPKTDSSTPEVPAAPSADLPGLDVCGLSKKESTKIVNVGPAKLGSWPWMVALGFRLANLPVNWLCGGSLINNRYVLTAAHCVTNHGRWKLAIARLGGLDLDDSVADDAKPIDVLVEKGIPHEDYNEKLGTSDIGLVKLNKYVEYTDLIRPICLPNPTTFTESLTGSHPVITGWGRMSYKGPSTSGLQEAQVHIKDVTSCAQDYKKLPGFKRIIDNRVLCAQSPLGKDACQGDSGGPLALIESQNYFAVGVLSYGRKCAEVGFPGVYTRVDLYLNWIQSNMDNDDFVDI